MKDPATGRRLFQQHHEVISREDEAQIYEELVADSDGNITTSFIALDEHVKDNRLQPRGWRADGPDAELTGPFGTAARDPDYRNGSGADALIYRIPLDRIAGATSISATLYYQSIPPYYLRQRFEAGGPEVERLRYMTGRLNLAATPIEGWKLRIANTEYRLSE